MALAYLLTSSVGYAARGSGVAGFLPESMAPGAARATVGALLAFHTAVAYLITALPLHRELVSAVRGMGASWTRVRCLAVTRCSFTLRLLRMIQPSFHSPRPPALPTLVQYYCTSIAQYTPPHRSLL